MILVNKTYTINSSSLPATWTLASDNTCGTAAELSGETTDGTIHLELQLQNETCFNNVEYTLVIEDSCGFVKTLVFTPDNLCTGWSISISHDSLLGFTGNVSGGSGTYFYEWAYDTTVFSESSNSDAVNGFLSLQVTGTPSAESYNVQLTVTDAIGCIQQLDFPFSVGQAVPIRPGSMAFTCTTFEEPIPNTTGVINRVTPIQVLKWTPVSGRTIDFSTLTFQGVPANVFAKHLGGGQIKFYANESASSSVSPLIKVTVKDSLGITSKPAYVGLVIPICAVEEYPISIDENYVFAPGEAIVGVVAEVPLEPLLATDTEIDWATFTFIAGTGQTLVSATELTGTFGTATIGIDRIVYYEIDALPTDACADIIRWKVQDVNEKLSKQGRIYFDYEVATAPVAVADSTCAVCGQSKTIQPLSNDTGDINPDSFNVTTAPTKGTYTFDNPDLTYIAGAQVSGSDTISYKVANPDGHFSNTVNITVTVVCAGEDNETTECKTVVDFTDFLSTWATAGCTWAAVVGNPSVVSLASPTAVDFSAAIAGTYNFTYTCTSGACSDVMTLTINLVAASANDTCANAIAMSYPILNTVSGQILACDTDSTLETVASTVQNPVSWATGSRKDVWVKFTTASASGSGFFRADGTAYGSNGIYQPMVAIYASTASPCALDDFTVLAQANAATGSRFVQVNFTYSSAGTYWIRIAALNANIGQFDATLSAV